MEDLAVIIDARALRTYPVGTAGFHGATESIVKILAGGLAKHGHTVHVITPDLVHEEQRGKKEWWWAPDAHPRIADVVVAAHSLETIGDLSAPLLVLLSNGIDSPLYGNGDMVDCVATLTDYHSDALSQRIGIPKERCFVTGLGVNLDDYGGKTKHRVAGRMLYANDPSRGLWHMLDIFDKVRLKVPHASLHVTYDFDRQFEPYRWQASAIAELMWECKRRLELTPGVASLGAVPWPVLLKEQQECHVHVMPSDPQNAGTQTHGLTQLELAAAGCPLVLSEIEAFPEVFGECATILPLPGMMRKLVGDEMMRVDTQDWADMVIELMSDSKKWKAASEAGRAVAARNTWGHFIDRWQEMLAMLIVRLSQAQEERAAA